MELKQRLINYTKSSFSGVAITTTEEIRVQGDIIVMAKELKLKILTWSITEGLRQVSPNIQDFDGTTYLPDALAAAKRIESAVYIIRDAQNLSLKSDPTIVRSIKDFLQWGPTKGTVAFFIGSSAPLHASYEKLVTVIDYDLPSKEDLAKIASGIAESAGQKGLIADENVLRAMGGLNTGEAENALALSFAETKGFDANVIYREKTNAVRRSGLLEIIEADKKGLDSVGGLENLKDWISKRKRAYTPEAEKFGLPAPKGILLVGVPGTGKSLAAKAIGTALGVPTIKLDIGSLFNSLVGESESRTRDALKLAEAMSPCILLIDEMEKGLAGSGGSGNNDSGVTRRVFGTILNWMQERRRPVFLVATANQVDALPPELLRKGRFDEIFSIDLPTDTEREEIFKIHLTKKGRDAAKFNLKALSHHTKEFTGSEIEEVVNSALYEAFDLNEELAQIHLIHAAEQTVPLSKTAKEQIDSIRGWGKGRARPAGKKEIETESATGRKLI
jgi:ATP-dependent 26S proteasome regulatory subunit